MTFPFLDQKCKTEEERKELVEKAEACLKASVDAKVPELPEVRIREWLPYNNYDVPDVVEAKEIGWSVPTLQRLWFGSSVEDKQKRLRAFLTAMRCDDCPLLLTQASVPQHMLILACVLRYIMVTTAASSGAGVALRKPELDAVLATAFSPELRNPRVMAEMKLDLVTRRGVQLSTMLMQGVEMAIMANDACGAPLPFQMCLPWTFFDGKLFHAKLRRADSARNLMELCDTRMDSVYAIERMRAAILHGLVPQYSGPPMPMPPQQAAFNAAVAAATNPDGPRMRPPQMFGPRFAGGGGGPPHPHPMLARGGQLVVGGSVVGQWHANFGGGPRPAMHKQQKKKNKKQVKKPAKSEEKSANGCEDNGASDAANNNVDVGETAQQAEQPQQQPVAVQT